MMDKEDLKINVISSISDEYVEEVTAERILAKKKVAERKRTFTAIASIAAAIVIIIGAFLPIMLIDNRQVPIYTGMTVSNEFPIPRTDADTMSNVVLCGSFSPSGVMHLKKPLGEAAKEHFAVEPGESPYYANPGEEIYITVTFDNPDDFVILSFTLNGKSYSSYMFEEGSDMENIVLKVNVGDVSGLISYTIDAIKYVDGDKIKDVKIGGDRTVNVGVYNENQPVASISQLNVTSTEISFDASVSDAEALISAVGGKIYAVIYDGDRIIEKREIAVGENSGISFNGLVPMNNYTVAVVAVFDAYDGNKTAPHVLCQEEVTTRVSAFAKNVIVDENDVSFELFYANGSVTVTKTELIDAIGNVIFAADGPVTEIKDLPGGKLRIRISYSYTEGGSTFSDTTETEFVCTKGMLPIIGEISSHYDGGVVMLPKPVSTWFSGHFGTDIVPTTESTEVYSITDGVVTSVVEVIYNPEALIFRCGKVEILDNNGIYHYYKFVDPRDLSVGDEVKAGDVIGVLCEPRENDMTIEYHVHYECYTLNGDVKTYLVPEFDTEPREISEGVRIEKIALSEEMLVTGSLSISGVRGSTVTYTTSFDFTYDDESVILNLIGQNEHVSIEKLDNGQYTITCDFTGITEPISVTLVYSICVAHNEVRFCDYITLTLVPVIEE